VELLTLLEAVTTDELEAPSVRTCCEKQRMAVLLELGPEDCSVMQPGAVEEDEGEGMRSDVAGAFARAWARSI
jgi:hypothetical protein